LISATNADAAAKPEDEWMDGKARCLKMREALEELEVY
jgi:hypothetical protein